ncbi:MAG: outer membrane protein assembly factor YaeT precursor [Acidobacteria bacterium]|nr:outer membrane protein assembly factor YaeT precursor [Acidobacteriota bacterium]
MSDAAAIFLFVFSGFIDLNASWNHHRPSSHENFFPGTGTTAKRANELSLNLVQLQMTQAVSAEQPLGYTLAVVAGDGDEVVHAGSEPRHVYQASVAWRLKSGIVVEGGIYPSHIGLEGFYSKDNWNYTRSWLGELSPYYQAGVKASYAFDSHWSAQVHLLNGWQVIHDNNGGKSIGTQLAYSGGPVSGSLNTFVDTDRKFVDVVALYEIRGGLQLGASADAGTDHGTRWNGIGGYARYRFDDRHALALRAERFNDPRNAISGTAQRLREATLTYEVRPREHLILKLEGRYDRSTADVFAAAGDRRTNDQLLALAGVVVTF